MRKDGRVKTLYLAGENVKNFVHSFFCPSVEEIKKHKAIRARRMENVSVKNIEDGFTGEAKDLDLSFLKEEEG